jgi:hypothetical protein
VKLEVRSTVEEQPVEQIDAQARRMPDQVERLRYLRALLILTPAGTRWWRRLPARELAAIGVAAALIGLAILVWILT